MTKKDLLFTGFSEKPESDNSVVGFTPPQCSANYHTSYGLPRYARNDDSFLRTMPTRTTQLTNFNSTSCQHKPQKNLLNQDSSKINKISFYCHTALDAVSPETDDEARGCRVKHGMTNHSNQRNLWFRQNDGATVETHCNASLQNKIVTVGAYGIRPQEWQNQQNMHQQIKGESHSPLQYQNAKKIKKIAAIFAIFFFTSFWFSSYAQQIHTVTNENDTGPNSLRQLIDAAQSGDIIEFASGVDNIVLASEISIDKNLTINGRDINDKITIDGNNNSRIFIMSMSSTLAVSNLVLQNGKVENQNGGAVWVENGCHFIATNCFFENNQVATGYFTGGAVGTNGIFTAINCVFLNNSSSFQGGAVGILPGTNRIFTAINCVFENNTANSGGGVFIQGNFTALNSVFTNNTATSTGGAINANVGGNAYLFHCTVEDNVAENGGGIFGWDCTLYSYNSIFLNNKHLNVVSEAGQIFIQGGGVFHNHSNLIDNSDGAATITSGTVFSTDITKPTCLAKTATPLTTADIQVPSGVSASEIITILATDKAGNPRSTSENITFGAYENVSCPGIPTITFEPDNGTELTKTGVDAAIQTAIGYINRTIKFVAIISNNVKSISNPPFAGCTGLISVTFPRRLESIGNNAFSGCTALETVKFLGKQPPTLGNNVFENIPSNVLFFVPNDDYKPVLTHISVGDITESNIIIPPKRIDINVRGGGTLIIGKP